MVKTKNGLLVKGKVYQEKPDKEIARYLVDRVLGKPRETVTLTGRVNFLLDPVYEPSGEK